MLRRKLANLKGMGGCIDRITNVTGKRRKPNLTSRLDKKIMDFTDFWCSNSTMSITGILETFVLGEHYLSDSIIYLPRGISISALTFIRIFSHKNILWRDRAKLLPDRL